MDVRAASVLPLEPQSVVCGLEHSQVEGINKLLHSVVEELVSKCRVVVDSFDPAK